MKKTLIIMMILLFLSGCSKNLSKKEAKKQINELIEEMFLENQELLVFKDNLKIKNISINDDTVVVILSGIDVSKIFFGEDEFFEHGDLSDLIEQSDKCDYEILLPIVDENGNHSVIATPELLNAVFGNSLMTYDRLLEEKVYAEFKNN